MPRYALGVFVFLSLGCAGLGGERDRPDCDLAVGDASLPTAELPVLTLAPTGLMPGHTRVPLLLSPMTLAWAEAPQYYAPAYSERDLSSFGTSSSAQLLYNQFDGHLAGAYGADVVTLVATKEVRTGWVALALDRVAGGAGPKAVELMGRSANTGPLPEPPNPLLAGQLLVAWKGGDAVAFQTLVDQTLQGCPDVYYSMGVLTGSKTTDFWTEVCDSMRPTVAACENADDVVTLFLVQHQLNDAHTQVAITVTLDPSAPATEVDPERRWGDVLPTLSPGPLNLVLRPGA